MANVLVLQRWGTFGMVRPLDSPRAKSPGKSLACGTCARGREETREGEVLVAGRSRRRMGRDVFRFQGIKGKSR